MNQKYINILILVILVGSMFTEANSKSQKKNKNSSSFATVETTSTQSGGWSYYSGSISDSNEVTTTDSSIFTAFSDELKNHFFEATLKNVSDGYICFGTISSSTLALVKSNPGQSYRASLQGFCTDEIEGSVQKTYGTYPSSFNNLRIKLYKQNNSVMMFIFSNSNSLIYSADFSAANGTVPYVETQSSQNFNLSLIKEVFMQETTFESYGTYYEADGDVISNKGGYTQSYSAGVMNINSYYKARVIDTANTWMTIGLFPNSKIAKLQSNANTTYYSLSVSLMVGGWLYNYQGGGQQTAGKIPNINNFDGLYYYVTLFENFALTTIVDSEDDQIVCFTVFKLQNDDELIPWIETIKAGQDVEIDNDGSQREQEVATVASSKDFLYNDGQGSIDEQNNVKADTKNGKRFTALSQQQGFYSVNFEFGTVNSGYICVGMVNGDIAEQISANANGSYKDDTIGFCSNKEIYGDSIATSGSLPSSWNNLKIRVTYQYNSIIFLFFSSNGKVTYSAGFAADNFNILYMEAQGKQNFKVGNVHEVSDVETHFETYSFEVDYDNTTSTFTNTGGYNQGFSAQVMAPYTSYKAKIVESTNTWMTVGFYNYAQQQHLIDKHDQSLYSTSVGLMSGNYLYNYQGGTITRAGSVPTYAKFSNHYVVCGLFEGFAVHQVLDDEHNLVAFAVYLLPDNDELMPWFETIKDGQAIQLSNNSDLTQAASLSNKAGFYFNNSQGDIDEQNVVSTASVGGRFFTAFSPQESYFTQTFEFSEVANGHICIGMVKESQLETIQANPNKSQKSILSGFCSNGDENGEPTIKSGSYPSKWDNLEVRVIYQSTSVIYLFFNQQDNLVYSGSYPASSGNVLYFEVQGFQEFQIGNFVAVNEVETNFQSYSYQVDYNDEQNIIDNTGGYVQGYSPVPLEPHTSFRMKVLSSSNTWMTVGFYAENKLSDIQDKPNTSRYSTSIGFMSGNYMYNYQGGQITKVGRGPTYANFVSHQILATVYQNFVLIQCETEDSELVAYTVYIKKDDDALLPWFETIAKEQTVQWFGSGTEAFLTESRGVQTQGNLTFNSQQGNIDEQNNVTTHSINGRIFTAFGEKKDGFFLYEAEINEVHDDSGYVCVGVVSEGQIEEIESNPRISYRSESHGICSDGTVNGTPNSADTTEPSNWANLKVKVIQEYSSVFFLFFTQDGSLVYNSSYPADSKTVIYFEAKGFQSFKVGQYTGLSQVGIDYESYSAKIDIDAEAGILTNTGGTVQAYSPSVFPKNSYYRVKVINSMTTWMTVGFYSYDQKSILQEQSNRSRYSTSIGLMSGNYLYNYQGGTITRGGSVPIYSKFTGHYVYATLFEDFALIVVENSDLEEVAHVVYELPDDDTLMPWCETIADGQQIEYKGSGKLSTLSDTSGLRRSKDFIFNSNQGNIDAQNKVTTHTINGKLFNAYSVKQGQYTFTVDFQEIEDDSYICIGLLTEELATELQNNPGKKFSTKSQGMCSDGTINGTPLLHDNSSLNSWDNLRVRVSFQYSTVIIYILSNDGNVLNTASFDAKNGRIPFFEVNGFNEFNIGSFQEITETEITLESRSNAVKFDAEVISSTGGAVQAYSNNVLPVNTTYRVLVFENKNTWLTIGLYAQNDVTVLQNAPNTYHYPTSISLMPGNYLYNYQGGAINKIANIPAYNAFDNHYVAVTLYETFVVIEVLNDDMEQVTYVTYQLDNYDSLVPFIEETTLDQQIQYKGLTPYEISTLEVPDIDIEWADGHNTGASGDHDHDHEGDHDHDHDGVNDHQGTNGDHDHDHDGADDHEGTDGDHDHNHDGVNDHQGADGDHDHDHDGVNDHEGVDGDHDHDHDGANDHEGADGDHDHNHDVTNDHEGVDGDHDHNHDGANDHEEVDGDHDHNHDGTNDHEGVDGDHDHNHDGTNDHEGVDGDHDHNHDGTNDHEGVDGDHDHNHDGTNDHEGVDGDHDHNHDGANDHEGAKGDHDHDHDGNSDLNDNHQDGNLSGIPNDSYSTNKLYEVDEPNAEWEVDQTTDSNDSSRKVTGLPEVEEYSVFGQVKVSPENKLSEENQWVFLFRLTSNSVDILTDYDNLGDRTLAVWYYNQQFHLFTYDLTTNNPNVTEAFDTTFTLSDLEEAAFTVYAGYSPAEKKVYASIKLGNGEYFDASIDNVTHFAATELNLFVGVDHDNTETYPACDGTYSDWYISTGEGSYQEEEEGLSKIEYLIDPQYEKCVMVFSECNYSGQRVVICDKQPKIEFYIKSALVPEGIAVRLYEEGGLQGQSIVYENSFECEIDHQYSFLLLSTSKVTKLKQNQKQTRNLRMN